jgi:hypothetical protein
MVRAHGRVVRASLFSLMTGTHRTRRISSSSSAVIEQAGDGPADWRTDRWRLECVCHFLFHTCHYRVRAKRKGKCSKPIYKIRMSENVTQHNWRRTRSVLALMPCTSLMPRHRQLTEHRRVRPAPPPRHLQGRDRTKDFRGRSVAFARPRLLDICKAAIGQRTSGRPRCLPGLAQAGTA